MDKVIQQLLDFRYSDFNARHVFTTKLRLLIYIGYWLLIFAFFPDLLWADWPVMFWVSMTFAVTTVCYYFILNEQAPYILFIVELMADVTAHTILIYITGGASSKLYIIYILYCLAGGLIYNWRVSSVISVLAFIAYSILLLLLHFQVVPPFDFEMRVAWFDNPQYQWLLNVILMSASLGVTIYANSIATYFNKQRERAVEARNTELVALNQISSSIRVAVNFQRVVDDVLRNLTRSFSYRGALILWLDEVEGKVKIYAENRRLAQEVGGHLGYSIENLFIPIDDDTNPVYQALKDHHRTLSNDLATVVKGVEPAISPEIAHTIQKTFKFQKIIAVPMITEQRMVGALIGLSSKDWLSEDDINTFQRYANQSALVLDNAVLIETLNNKNEELERVSRVKSEFLATMSHELRTPLTAIIGFSELLLEGVLGELSDDQNDSLTEVLSNAENLLQLINSLLDLAKIEAGKMELQWSPVNLAEIAERVQRSVSALIRKKKHTLQVLSADDLPTFYGDERKVQQAILNLVSNAIKFTDEGGHIEINVNYYAKISEQARWSFLSDKSMPMGGFEISVRDTGIGIAEEDLELIFESFRQVDSSFTRNYQGTGLGLGLAQQFVEMHGGCLIAESEIGQGSTFCMLLPRVNPPAELA